MNKGYRVFLAVFRALLLFFVFLPILWGLRTSIAASNMDLNIIPRQITLKNYLYVLNNGSFLSGIRNSVIYAAGTIVLLLPIIIPAAYAFSRMKFRGNILSKLLLVLPLLPAIVILIPLSRNMNAMGLLNKRMGVILLNVTFQLPFTCWLLRNFFKSISVSIEEASYVDGCSRLQSIILIIIPSALTGIVSIVVYSFISSWLSYLVPYTLITSMSLKSISQTLLGYQGQFGTDYTRLTAASLLTIVPPLTVFCLFQKWFIAGLFGMTSK
jgi:multiple sugar transport system permease protein